MNQNHIKMKSKAKYIQYKNLNIMDETLQEVYNQFIYRVGLYMQSGMYNNPMRIDGPFLQLENTIDSNPLLSKTAIEEVLAEAMSEEIIDSALLYEVIDYNPNVFSIELIQRMLERGWLDLNRLNVAQEFKDALVIAPVKQKLDETNYEIPTGIEREECTEVYFWGVPQSGKTCALGAILSSVPGIAAMRIHSGIAYGYAHSLSGIFRKGDVGELPPGTAIDHYYAIHLDLTERENGILHKVTLIDMAGELMCCMYKKNAKEVTSEKENNMIATMDSFLTPDVPVEKRNRKMHFFVLEYDGHNKQYNGHTQQEYLEGAADYLRDRNLFSSETDGIYLLVTKVDKCKDKDGLTLTGEKLKEELLRYLNGPYENLCKTLKDICRTNEINGKELNWLPFSVGDVAFRKYCLFNDKHSRVVVRTIIQRSTSYRPGILHKIRKMLGL